MAGEALEELSAKDEGFRNSVERRVGTEEYERISADGAQALDDGGRMTANEVISEFRNRPSGVSVNEGDDSMVAKYQKMVDDGTTFNAKARTYLEGHGINFGGSGPGEETPPEETPDIEDTPGPIAPAPEPEPENDPWPFPPGLGGGVVPAPMGSQVQQVQQDNDINTTISGSNNIVTNNQDNSIRQSAGSRYLSDWMHKHNFFA